MFAKNLAGYLHDAKHEVTVITSNDRFRTEVDRSLGYQVIKFRSLPNPFRKGFRITVAPYSEVNSFISNIKPDVAHLQDPAPISRLVARICQKSKLPVVVTNHFSMDFILSYLKKFQFLNFLIIPLVRRNIVSLYDRCSIITTPSETAENLIKLWGSKTEIKVMSNGVDIKRFCPGDKTESRKILGLPDKPTVLYVGRIDKDKSLAVLIRAVPLVAKRMDVNFAIVGAGDSLEEMKMLAHEVGASKNISFLGSFDHGSAKLCSVYQSADLFASPSKIETQSIVMLEAMAAGLPIVAARAGSFPEFVADARSGYLFTPDSFSEMAGKIVKLLEDKNLLKDFGHAARVGMMEHDMDRSLDRFPNLYKRLIDETSRP